MKVAIIGGGITGLTAAYYLQKEALAQNSGIDVDLFESSRELGGKIKTNYYKDFIIEQGPDSFLARKESAAKLAKEVGLEQELFSNTTGQAYVLKDDILHPIPGGAVMGIPTKLGPFLTTGLFSPIGKLRAALDLVLPKYQTVQDQSLGEFFRRRLGSEVVDNLIEPLLSGIYAGNIDRLSLQSTFPQFKEVEQQHRSLILGMKAQRRPKTEPQKKQGAFLTLKNGLQSFVDAIENHLDEDAVYKEQPLEKIVPNDEGYQLRFQNGETRVYDNVVFTTPPHVTASFFQDEKLKGGFSSIPSTSVATIAMAFDKSQITSDFHGTGFVVSKKSDYHITACTFTHLKWGHTAPDDKALLRCYVGKPGEEAIVDKEDEELKDIVLKDLNRVIAVNGDPEYYKVTRWHDAMPQYEVHHQQQINELFQTLQDTYPGVFVAGAGYHGVGLPDCIKQGEEVIQQILSAANIKPALLS
ncbi:oxygen-dependent protoporphyrinogen oxidase [Alteribacillus persepolensis]|uniref:Coproporphyrinogen III oxidase n=1 Tax=Alteribacillus persepolensis TaxID=568899 RepID=A0A1G8DFU7_9BACI|nr:protoporphyrinogen oxidase [Alteribacillus persepolensis]SDH56444.1 oxygen-dependent protoporphyrinogen oxidase [Alteribacillus persepolensis]